MPNIYGGNLKTLHITEQDEVEYVYELLKETKIEHVNRWPDHSLSLQFDAEFQIQIEYQNGKIDKYTAPLNDSNCIFRFLETRGNSNDPGYIKGSNNKLWDYIISLK